MRQTFNQNNFKAVLLSFVLISLLSIGGIGQQSNKLIGNWKFESNGLSVLLQIKPGNQLIFDGEAARYDLVENAIRVYDEYGFYYDYAYTLSDNTLHITFPDGYQYPFFRAAGSPENMTGQPAMQNQGQSQAQNPPQPENGTNKGGNNPKNRFMYGSLCSYSSSSGYGSSYSSSEVLTFDGNGNFSYRQGSSYSGGGDMYYNSGADDRIYGTYQVMEGYVLLLYKNGNVQNTKINITQNSGEITELLIGSVLFAKSLCE